MSSSSSIVTRKRFHGVLIRSMAPGDVESADHVMRVSFGTFSGLSNPSSAFGEAQYVRPRYEAEPSWAFVAAYGGDVVGSVFATAEPASAPWDRSRSDPTSGTRASRTN